MTTPIVRLADEAVRLRQHADDHWVAVDALERLPMILAELDAALVALTEAEAEANRLAGMVAERDITIFDLQRQLAAGQPVPAPVKMLLTANCSGPYPTRDVSYAYYKDCERRFGARLPIPRMFDGGKVLLSSEAKDALADGRPVHFSIAPNVDSLASGGQDAAVRTIAQALVRVPGSTFTALHEPENPNKNISGAQFRAAQDRFYLVAKGAAPGLSVGPAHQSYQYEGTWAPRGRDGSYITSSGDFYGLDYYTLTGAGGKTRAQEIANQPGWAWWYGLVKDRALAENKPILLVEYGVQTPDRAERERILRADHAYLSSLPVRVERVSLWLGWGDAGDWATGLLESSAVIRELYQPPPL